MAYKSNPTQDFLKAIGENIRYYRQKRGFTLEALGDDIGLDKGNMHKIEAGKNITVLTLLKISLFLEVDPVKLLDTDVNISFEDAEKYVAQKKNERAKTKKKPAKKKKR